MRLTTGQRLELFRHSIPLFEVFDASGMSTADAKKAMSVNKEAVMINGLPCSKDRTHLLRSRYGICVGCNPATLAMQSRKRRSGFVYVAGTKSAPLIKVGMTLDVKHRERMLKHYCYGGVDDWQVLAVVKASNAGRVEKDAQDCLKDSRVDASYWKDGRDQVCDELFQCTHDEALRALKAAALHDDAEIIMEATPNGRFGIRP